jgi:hypothetical protein
MDIRVNSKPQGDSTPLNATNDGPRASAELAEDGASRTVAPSATVLQRRSSEVDRRIDALTDSLKRAKFDSSNSNTGSTNDFEKPSVIAARLVSLLPSIRLRGEIQWAMNAEIAATHLLTTPPNSQFAAKIVDDLSWRAGSRRSSATYSLWVGLAAFFTLAVLVTFVGTAYVLPALNSAVNAHDPFKLDTLVGGLPIITYLLVGLFGGLGSVASIAIRAEGLDNGLEPMKPLGLFVLGLTKPIVGIIFALFIAAVIQAEVVPLKPSENVKPFLLIAVAFIAGFSERFASDVATRFEGSVSSPRVPPSQRV